jgi:hypothetical protein
MIDSLYNMFFGCRHRRTSFPLRPATKPGEPPEDMYVVCLDCGKRFHYDWEQMRVGEEVEDPERAPEVRKKPRLPYILAVSTLPFLWIIGKMAVGKRHSKPEKEHNPELKP